MNKIKLKKNLRVGDHIIEAGDKILILKEQEEDDETLEEFVKNNFKRIVDDCIEIFTDISVVDFLDDSDDVYSFLADNLPGKFEVYKDGREIFIVKNIKGRGFPDWDKVIREASKKSKIPEEHIRNYCTEDFLDSLFWDDVHYVQEDVFKDYGDFAVVGRSGGYWGLIPNIWDLKWNVKELKNKLESLLSDNRILAKLDVFPSYNTSLFNERITEDLFDYMQFSKREANKYIEIPKDVIKTFSDFDKDVEAVIKEFESINRWVEIIIANEYWEY